MPMKSIQANTAANATSHDDEINALNLETKVTGPVEVEVVKLSKKGEGIAYYQDRELYIKDVLPHEVLQVMVGEPFVATSKRAPAYVTKIVKSSEYRNDDMECAYAGVCGGCQYMHVSLEHQLELKKHDICVALKAALGASKLSAKSDDIISHTLKDVVGSTLRPCRFKSIRYFAMADGVLQQGFYKSRTHDLVTIDKCALEPESFSTLASSLTTKINALGLSAYADGNAVSEDKSLEATTAAAAKAAATKAAAVNTAEATSAGASTEDVAYVRALTMREGDDNKVMLNLTVTAKLDAQAKEELKAWAQDHASLIASFYVSINNREGNALFTDECELLAFAPTLDKHLLAHKYEVGPNTFLQVNYEICEKLYEAAIKHCSNVVSELKKENDKIKVNALDLCCGAGTMTLPLAKSFDEVLGIEIVEGAIIAAKHNAQNNNIKNAHFIAGDISAEIPKAIKRFSTLVDSEHRSCHLGGVIADPPRVGLGEKNVKALAKLKGPVNLSLIFCALSALKRDLPLLLDSGYEIESVQGFDMFPHSSHVETLVLLKKR